MPGRFILSLDCEGKWGVADLLDASHHAGLSDAALRAAYDGILAALDETAIPASFAFVGLFALPAERLRALEPDLAGLAARAPGYLGAALDDALRGTGQGWSGDWALEAVRSAKVPHELALHGVTHVPWDQQDAGFFRDEMALFAAEAPFKPTTFIYPRNAVAHTEVLAEAGIAGYRETRPFKSRVHSLLSELDLFAPVDSDPPAEPLQRIPAGYFVNWLSGPRALIPADVSRSRARSLLRRAARDGGVVHYWTHPENIATAPATLGLLHGILQDVAALRDAGQIEVITQAQYVAERQGDK